MVDLRSLEHRYPLGHRAMFEDLCTQLFRRRLGLTDGASVYRPPNQRGVESEPVEVGGRTYAYQVKYFDAETRLRDRKAELLPSITISLVVFRLAVTRARQVRQGRPEDGRDGPPHLRQQGQVGRHERRGT